MFFLHLDAGRLLRRFGSGAAIAATIGLYAAGTANAAATTPAAGLRPLPIAPGTNITNSVTSNTTGSNCVTGTEPGCSVVLVAAVPVIDPAAGVVPAVLATAAVGVFFLRRRAATDA
jgi:hypothetical protein